MERIELPRTLVIALLHDAQRTPDREVCGLIATRDRQVLRAVPVHNAAMDPRHLFDMDERELIDAMKTMRANGETLFAIYHSHPDAAPEPSRVDIERAGHPDALHLIISLQVKGVLQMRGWRLNGETPQAVEVGVAEDT
ncbi:MAG TPA: M67 family metallopeptidase [Gammaproteobacteria bacterium]